MDFNTDLSNLSKSEIMKACETIVFGSADKRSRAHLLESVALLPQATRDRIYEVSAAKRKAIDVGGDPTRKRRKAHNNDVDDDRDGQPELSAPPMSSEFFKTSPQETVETCIARFIDRTGNAALSLGICVVCARELFCLQLTRYLLDEIPNRHLLAPFEPHPAHVLTEGLLLHRQAIFDVEEKAHGYVCVECVRNLKKNRVPRLALANGMWTGDVPFELSVLTIPEQILISRHFPAAYIVKMFPKRRGAKSLNSGVRGNVSMYRLDTKEIADLIEGNLMPCPLRILASTIGVTFVGPKNLPEKSMPGFLHTRRARVRNALVWLIKNNPFYADIVISDDRLDEIPEDGIPNEILAAMRYSDDTEEVDRERAGYVPDDEQYGGSDDFGDEGPYALYGNDAAGTDTNDALGAWIENCHLCRRCWHRR